MKRALVLFCKAGGVCEGLARAGFDVTGVDIEPQPNYRHKFIQGDATRMNFSNFDLVWASPPCQGFTAYKRRPNHVKPRPNLIPAVRAKLIKNGIPYIIENVPGAPLLNPTVLCGSMFGLDVRRHRLFECSFAVKPLKCDHSIWTPRFPQATNRRNPRKTVEIGVWRIPLPVQQQAMGGLSWMTREELSEAIPPAYAEHLARSFLAERKRCRK